MRLPTFTDLTDQQRDVYDQPPDHSILVVGPPGSGKTSMAIWRARLLVSPELRRSVVLVTRNRLLVAVAGQLAREDGGAAIQATTMNSLISRDYYGRFNRNIPTLDGQYEYDWERILGEYQQATVVPTVNHLIIDEGQNLPSAFFRWAVRFGAQAVSVFADEHQSTLGGAGTRVADLAAAGFAHVLPLLVNHRNTQEIIDVVEHFHVERTLPLAASSRGLSQDRPRLIDVSSWESLSDMVVARLANRAESIGVIVFRKSEVVSLKALLRARAPGARIDSYTSDTPQGLEAGIRIRESGITVISGESAIGLEFDTLYLQDISRSLPRTTPLDSRRLYMLCARARNTLMLINGPGNLTPAQLASLPPSNILTR